MDMSFDSPARLERRIAQNMAAADISDDLASLGVGRRAPSISDLSFSLESDTNYFDQQEEEESTGVHARQRGAGTATASSRLGTPRVAALQSRRSPLANIQHQSPGPTPRPSHVAQHLKPPSASSSLSSSTNLSFSQSLDRPPSSLPLTSTPQAPSAGMRSQTTISRSIVPPPRLELATAQQQPGGSMSGSGSGGMILRRTGPLATARKSGLSNVTNASSEGASTAWGSARDGLSAPQDGVDELRFSHPSGHQDDGGLAELSVDSLRELGRDQDDGADVDDSLATDTRGEADEGPELPPPQQQGSLDNASPSIEHAPLPESDAGDTSAQSELSGRDTQRQQQQQEGPGVTGTMHTSEFSVEPDSSAVRAESITKGASRSGSLRSDASTQRGAPQQQQQQRSVSNDGGATARGEEIDGMATQDVSASRRDDIDDDTEAGASRLARSAAITTSTHHDEASSSHVTSSPAAGRAERRRHLYHEQQQQQQKSLDPTHDADGETQESVGWEPSVMPSQVEDQDEELRQLASREHEMDEDQQRQRQQQQQASMATPRPSKMDTERMKQYVLSSVKVVNPLREAQLRRMTPRPALRMGGGVGLTPHSATPGGRTDSAQESSPQGDGTVGARMDRLGRLNVVGAGRTPLPMRAGLLAHLQQQQASLEGSPSDSASQAGFSDASSTRDLTRPFRQAALRGNTSLPGIGLGLGGGGGGAAGEDLASLRRPPVDPARLQGYLHKMNARLEEENVGLQEDNERLRRALNKALMEMERRGPGGAGIGISKERLSSEADAMSNSNGEEGVVRKEAGGEEAEGIAGAQDDQLGEAMERIRELEAGQEELNDLLDEREEEIEELKARLEEQHPQQQQQHDQHEPSRTTTAPGEDDDAAASTPSEEASSALALKRQVQNLELVIEDRESEIRDLQSEIEGHRRRFEEQLRAAMEDADELQQEAEREWAAEREALRSSKQEAEERMQELRSELERIKRHDALEGDGETTRERKRLDLDESRIFAEVQHLQAEIDELKTELEEKDQELGDVKDQLQKAQREVEELKEVEVQLEGQLREFDEANAEMEMELNEVNARLDAVEEEKDLLVKGLEKAEKEGAEARDELLDLRIAIEEKQSEILKLESDLRETEEQLKFAPATTNAGVDGGNDKATSVSHASSIAAEKRIESLEAALTSSKERVTLLEKRLAESQTALRASRNGNKDIGVSPSSSLAAASKAEQSLLLSEVKQLRSAKKQLEKRLETYKEQQHHILSSSSIAIAAATGTPVHRNIANLRTPIRTPMGPAGELSNASWLYNDSTLGDGGVVENIHNLQQLLDAANASIDEKLEEIDRQGVNHLTLSRKLLEAKARIEELEEELRRLRKEGLEEDVGKVRVVAGRIKRVRCTSCKTRFDATEQLGVSPSALPRQTSIGNLSAASTSTSAHLARSQRSAHREKVLSEVVEQLEELKAKWSVDRERFERDRKTLDEEKREWDVQRRALRDENELLKEERRGKEEKRREEARMLQAQTQAELERAKMVIRDFDQELRSDRDRLRALVGQTQRSGDESAWVEAHLRSTEAQLRAVEAELSDKARRHQGLHADLMERSASASLAAELPAQLRELDQQVRQMATELDLLRKQRKTILEERRGLHDRFRTAAERFENVHAELSLARQTMEAHQAQLDEQIETIERLHATLQEQDAELKRVAGDRERLLAQRGEIIDEVASLEKDLRRVREESERFGNEVERMRRRKAGVPTALGSNDAVGGSASTSAAASEMERRRHLVAMELQLAHQRFAQEKLQSDAATRAKHHAECKGLLLQIRYLKAKYMRESDLRADASHQKRYLTQLVGGLQLSERETTRFIADLQASRGLSAPDGGVNDELARERSEPAKKLARCLKTVHAAVRMRLMAERWRQTCEVKKALLEAQLAAKARKAQREASTSNDAQHHHQHHHHSKQQLGKSRRVEGQGHRHQQQGPAKYGHSAVPA